MLCALRVICAPVFILTNIDQHRITAFSLLLRFDRRNLGNVLLRFCDQFLKPIHRINVRPDWETSMLKPQ